MSRGRVAARVAVAAIVLALATAGLVSVWSNRRTLPEQHRTTISSITSPLNRVILDPEGRFLASGGASGGVNIGRLPGGFTEQIGEDTGDPLTLLTLSADGMLLAGDSTGRLRAWQAPEFSEVSIESPGIPAACAVFRKESGQMQIILGLVDGRLVVIADDGISIFETGHRSIKAMTLTPDGKELITSGSEGTIIRRDLENQRETEKLVEHRTEVPYLEWSPDGEQLVSADWNGRIRVIDFRKFSVIASASQPDAVSGLAWRGDRILTGSWDGNVRFWKLDGDGLEMTNSFDTDRPIHSMATDLKGDSAVSVSGSADIDIWDLSAE